ncbi:MAG: helix-turn-helix transcriptional regulator [Sphingomonas sp.]|nr:helix-turn-helix transcriptional regulator [Sphingomonas sp.]
MDQHLEAPRTPSDVGKLVLSRLKGGSSPLGARNPSLKIVLEGECRYEVDGAMLRVRPGQFLYLDSGANCIASHRGDMTGMCVILPARGEPGVAGSGHAHLLGRSLVLSTRTSGMGRVLEEYGRRIARDPRLGHRLADNLVRTVTAAIESPLHESQAAMARLTAVKVSTRRTLFQRLERARGHLHENDDRSVALGELASVAGLSQFHLARYFKLAFGEAPIAYHRKLRLERAATLLISDNHSLIEIADLTGYSDEVALSHAFRRHYGKPPQLWATERRRG